MKLPRALFLTLVCACGSTQDVPLPDQLLELEDDWLARIYLTRDLPAVRGDVAVGVFDGSRNIGTLEGGFYFCWERPPGDMNLRVVEAGRGDVRLGLLARAGQVYYCDLSLGAPGEKMKLRAISAEEGRRRVRASAPPRVPLFGLGSVYAGEPLTR